MIMRLSPESKAQIVAAPCEMARTLGHAEPLNIETSQADRSMTDPARITLIPTSGPILSSVTRPAVSMA